jgi:hypothetical protein
MTAPNAELAWRVLDHIDAHPESWDQGLWWCDTSGCFAGWTCTLSGERPIDGGYDIDHVPNGTSVPERAAQLLGFKDREDLDAAGEAVGDAWLFCGDNDREDLGKYVEAIFGPRPDAVA